MPSKRRLAVIMFTDIVGYTSLMAEDEGKALNLLNSNHQFHKKLISKYNGTILKEMGDGILAAFDSTTNSILAAESLHAASRENNYHLRIGIHQGEVVFKKNDVFGDGVNIASRIENIAKAGQTLVSSDVYGSIQNKDGINSILVGKKPIKGIKDPIDLYAVVVDSDMITSLSRRSGNLRNIKLPIRKKGLLLITVAILSLVSYFFLAKAYGRSGPKLSSEVRDGRVAVTVFENQTSRDKHDFLGYLIAELITTAFMEADQKVVSYLSVKENMNIITGNQPSYTDFAANTGADVIISGRYYLIDNKMSIIFDIVDALTLDPITQDKVSGAEENLEILLDDLNNKILSLWAVKDDIRFKKNPPNHEAYKLFLEAENMAIIPTDENGKKRRIDLLKKAYQTDTTFYAPFIRLAIEFPWPKEWNDDHAFDEMDSSFLFLEKRKHNFNRWEKLRFEQYHSIRYGNLQKYAEVSIELHKIDPFRDGFSINAESVYLRSYNDPAKALKMALNNPDPYGKASRAHTIASAYYTLKKYDEVLNVIDSVGSIDKKPGLQILHLLSLARKKKNSGIDILIQEYLEKGLSIYDLRLLCSVYAITGNIEMVEKCKQIIVNQFDFTKESTPLANILGPMYFFSGQYRESVDILENALPNIQSEDKRIWAKGYYGAALARLGNSQKAREVLSSLNEEYDKVYHPSKIAYLNQFIPYAKIMILASLGELDEAVAELKVYFNSTIKPYRYGLLENDYYLGPLFNYQPFIDIMQPVSTNN